MPARNCCAKNGFLVGLMEDSLPRHCCPRMASMKPAGCGVGAEIPVALDKAPTVEGMFCRRPNEGGGHGGSSVLCVL